MAENIRPKIQRLIKERLVNNVRPEIQELIDRGSVTSAELKELRCNSWEWQALVPAMTNEALLDRTRHALDNSTPPHRPASTYDEAVIGVFAPVLMERLAKATAEAARHREEARGYAEVIDNVREALGQEATHYLVVADDVRDLVEAVERDAAALSEYTRRRQLGELVHPPDELHSEKTLRRLRENASVGINKMPERIRT